MADKQYDSLQATPVDKGNHPSTNTWRSLTPNGSGGLTQDAPDYNMPKPSSAEKYDTASEATKAFRNFTGANNPYGK